MIATRDKQKSRSSRPLIEKLSTYSLFIFIGYCVADLTIISMRDQMLPTHAPPPKPPQTFNDNSMNLGNFNSITARNIFSNDGIIPDALQAKNGLGGGAKELPPIPTQLPLNLIGTLVHSNPDKSIATIEVKGKNQILSYNPKKEIENLATVEKVERLKVFIRNLNTGRMEFLEMHLPSTKVSFGTNVGAGGGKEEVRKLGENEYEMKRSDLLKYTSDLSSVLMQARAVPARRGGNGDIYGFRMLEIQPGSIYSQLGLQIMDVITGVNGTPVTSPQQAMEMYGAMRNANEIVLQVERGGRIQTVRYKVTN